MCEQNPPSSKAQKKAQPQRCLKEVHGMDGRIGSCGGRRPLGTSIPNTLGTLLLEQLDLKVCNREPPSVTP